MRVTFLGTGTSLGVPLVGSDHPVCLSVDKRDWRLRSSALVEVDGVNILIDCGPDFRQQMLKNNVGHINGILFTHEHADHTAGLDDIRPYYYRQGKIPIYAKSRTMEQLSIRFQYMFGEENKHPGVAEIHPVVVDNTPFLIDGVEVIPIQVSHGKLDILGFRIKDFAYITDAKMIKESEMYKLKGLESLVVNALRTESHVSHFNLEEALKFIERVGAKRHYITHISHLMGFYKEVSESLPKNVYLAYDNLVIYIS